LRTANTMDRSAVTALWSASGGTSCIPPSIEASTPHHESTVARLGAMRWSKMFVTSGQQSVKPLLQIF
jgi:hypothetical protein